MNMENTNKNFISLLKRLTVFSMALVKKFHILNSCKITFDGDLNLNIQNLIKRKSLDNVILSSLSSSLRDFSQNEISVFEKEFNFLRVFEFSEVYIGEMKEVQDSLILLHLILTGEIKNLTLLKKKYMELQMSAIYDEYKLKAMLFFKTLSTKGQSLIEYLETKVTSTDKNEQLLLLIGFLKDNRN